MFRDKVGFILLLAVGLLATLATDASACGRCRRNPCIYYRPAYVAPVVQHVHNPPDVTNFVFNNAFPTPYLQADQGSSVFGYSLAAKAYQFDPNQYLDRSVRLQELSIENQRLSQDGANQLAGLALETQREFNRQFANTAAFQALVAANGGDAGGSVQSFRVTVQGGELRVEKVDVEGGGGAGGGPAVDPGDQPPAVNPPAGGSAAAASCFNCHGGKNEEATAAIRLDPLVAITSDERKAINLAVMSGRMPPKAGLSDEAKAALLAELCKIPAK